MQTAKRSQVTDDEANKRGGFQSRVANGSTMQLHHTTLQRGQMTQGRLEFEAQEMQARNALVSVALDLSEFIEGHRKQMALFQADIHLKERELLEDQETPARTQGVEAKEEAAREQLLALEPEDKHKAQQRFDGRAETIRLNLLDLEDVEGQLRGEWSQEEKRRRTLLKKGQLSALEQVLVDMQAAVKQREQEAYDLEMAPSRARSAIENADWRTRIQTENKERVEFSDILDAFKAEELRFEKQTTNSKTRVWSTPLECDEDSARQKVVRECEAAFNARIVHSFFVEQRRVVVPAEIGDRMSIEADWEGTTQQMLADEYYEREAAWERATKKQSGGCFLVAPKSLMPGSRHNSRPPSAATVQNTEVTAAQAAQHLAHMDQLRLLSGIGITEAEATEAEEEHEWTNVLSVAFCEEYQAIELRCALRDLEAREDHIRQEMVIDLRLLDSKLAVQSELLRHGCISLSVGDGAGNYSVQEIAELERRPPRPLPDYLLSMSTASLGVTEPVADLKKQLRAEQVHGDDAADTRLFLDTLEGDVLVKDEEAARFAIKASEGGEFRRMKRTFQQWRLAFADMEQELVHERDGILMARMNPEEKVRYVTRHVVADEHGDRTIIDLESVEQCQSVTLGNHEEGVRIQLLERFYAGLTEIRNQWLSTAFKQLIDDNTSNPYIHWFRTWKTWAHGQANMIKAVKAVDDMERRCQDKLMRKACRCLNFEPQRRKVERQRSALLTEELEAYCLVVMREEEERARISLTMEWVWHSEQIAELFFSERDIQRWELLANQVSHLSVDTEEELLRMRLVLWYRFARRKGLHRRFDWILTKVHNDLKLKYLMQWMGYPSQRIEVRGYREVVSAAEEKQRNIRYCVEEEARGRLAIRHGQARLLNRRRAQCAELLFWQTRRERVVALASKRRVDLMRNYVTKLKKFPGVHNQGNRVLTLRSKNLSLLSQRYVSTWTRAAAMWSLQSSETAARMSVMDVEATENRANHLARCREALEFLWASALDNLQHRAMSQWIRGHKRQMRLRRELPAVVDLRARRYRVALLHRHYRVLKLHRWLLVRPRLAAMLQARSEEKLLQRYFSMLNPITLRLRTISRLRKQLQAARLESSSAPQSESKGLPEIRGAPRRSSPPPQPQQQTPVGTASTPGTPDASTTRVHDSNNPNSNTQSSSALLPPIRGVPAAGNVAASPPPGLDSGTLPEQGSPGVSKRRRRKDLFSQRPPSLTLSKKHP